jgi:hypothetical protein
MVIIWDIGMDRNQVISPMLKWNLLDLIGIGHFSLGLVLNPKLKFQSWNLFKHLSNVKRSWGISDVDVVR